MINSFKDEYRFLSNFFPLKNPIMYESVSYPTSEHFFQAMKTVDKEARVKIASLKIPGETKRAGRAIVLRPDWDQVKLAVMTYALEAKFENNLELKAQLLSTENETLIEGNHWHDNFWGDCSCPKCTNIIGQNHLGKLLMELREKMSTTQKGGNMKSCNVTGHRKITPQGYTGGSWWTPTCPIVEQYHNTIKQSVMATVIKLHQENDVVEFISGGAIGADILFAEAVIELRDVYKYQITLGIAKPFPSQHTKWSWATTARYNNVLSAANWVYDVAPDPYSPAKMQIRNEWMVNRAGILLALWNGKHAGGTWNCINYAQRLGRTILTINV